ncbi:unnamed protein product [Cylindrotheca closterium]|uniref:Uncharacterized protein n=1 Tax=Cylindrotheca closterium TaxID=2856 RepID=A0AAD2CGY0_9STRA|nr:unnamed protein product [Cylindrotheca closterium]
MQQKDLQQSGEKDITVEAILAPTSGSPNDPDDSDAEEEVLLCPLELDAATVTAGLAAYEKLLWKHGMYKAASAAQYAREEIFHERRNAKQKQLINKRKQDASNRPQSILPNKKTKQN